MKLTAVTQHAVHVTQVTFLRSWLQRSTLKTTFSESALFQWRNTKRWFAVDDRLVLCRVLNMCSMVVKCQTYVEEVVGFGHPAVIMTGQLLTSSLFTKHNGVIW